jgi:hypothetical protein
MSRKEMMALMARHPGRYEIWVAPDETRHLRDRRFRARMQKLRTARRRARQLRAARHGRSR